MYVEDFNKRVLDLPNAQTVRINVKKVIFENIEDHFLSTFDMKGMS